MRGIITQRAYGGRRWCIVKGEDGIEYFFSYKALVDPKQYKHYSWVGNRAVFDRDESPEYYRPHAKNVILAEMKDPNLKEKRLRKMEQEKLHLAKEEKKRTEKERQAILKERADRKKEYESNNTWYEVQVRSDNGWETVCLSDVPVRRRTVAEAKQAIETLKDHVPECRFRFVKTTGMVITVHRKRGDES